MLSQEAGSSQLPSVSEAPDPAAVHSAPGGSPRVTAGPQDVPTAAAVPATSPAVPSPAPAQEPHASEAPAAALAHGQSSGAAAPHQFAPEQEQAPEQGGAPSEARLAEPAKGDQQSSAAAGAAAAPRQPEALDEAPHPEPTASPEVVRTATPFAAAAAQQQAEVPPASPAPPGAAPPTGGGPLLRGDPAPSAGSALPFAASLASTALSEAQLGLLHVPSAALLPGASVSAALAPGSEGGGSLERLSLPSRSSQGGSSGRQESAGSGHPAPSAPVLDAPPAEEAPPAQEEAAPSGCAAAH